MKLLCTLFSFIWVWDSNSVNALLDDYDYKFTPGVEAIEEPDLRDLGPDLEEMAQDFILETKRIFIPGFPDAFNPSILRWEGRLLMCFRTYDAKTRVTNKIGIVYLNEQFEPVGEPTLVKFLQPDPYCGFKKQDPRLVAIDGRLHIVYNNSFNGEVRRMLIGVLEKEGGEFVVPSSECLLRFEGERAGRSEKNWVPFDYNGALHLAYSIVPHKILSPLGSSDCATVSATLPPVKWDWGVLRGGTPALLDGEEYLAFFHSVKTMATVHSKGVNMPHYFMGAYTFSAQPPFHITRISQEPIVGRSFYKGPAYKTYRPVRVVFPGGYVADEKFVWILYGRQDHEIWVVKIDKKGLLDNLVPL